MMRELRIPSMEFHFTAPKSLRGAAATALLIASCFLAGCAMEPMPTGSRLVISAPIAELYKNGPAQDPSFQSPQLASFRTVSGPSAGPDAQLPRGASVTLLRREIGFSRVVTDDGMVGYVANDQLQKAPAITRAAATAAPSWSPPGWRGNPSPSRSKPPRTSPPEEKLDLSDIPLPLPS